MRSKAFFSTVLLAILLGGCSTAPAAAPVPAPTAASPTAPAPATAGQTTETPTPPGNGSGQTGCVATPQSEPYGTMRRSSKSGVSAGTCEANVDTGEIWIYFTLPYGITESAARSALRVSGSEKPVLGFFPYSKGMVVSVYFPPGRPGDLMTVQLSGPVGKGGAPADLGYVLRRSPTPQVSAAVRPAAGGDWVPVNPGDSLPPGPFTLRVTAPAAVDMTELTERITQGLTNAGVSTRVEKLDARTLTVDIAAPPPRLIFDLKAMNFGDALNYGDRALTLNTGVPPYLAAVDPRTGAEGRLSPAPADVYLTAVAPDGSRAALVGMAPDSERIALWVANLRTGELRRTPLLVDHLFPAPAVWLQDRLVIPDRGMVQSYGFQDGHVQTDESRATGWSAPSPDLRYLPGFFVDDSTEHPDWLAPASVVLHDLTTGQERIYPAAAMARIHQADSPPTLPMVWTADGKGLLIETSQGSPAQRWLRLDPLTGETAVDAGPKQPNTSGLNGWNQGKWGAVNAPDTGKTLGQGLLAGSLPDGRLLILRWEGFRQIRPMPGP